MRGACHVLGGVHARTCASAEPERSSLFYHSPHYSLEKSLLLDPELAPVGWAAWPTSSSNLPSLDSYIPRIAVHPNQT